MIFVIFITFVLTAPVSGLVSCLTYRYFQNKHTYTNGAIGIGPPDDNGNYNWTLLLSPSDIPEDTEFILLTVLRE